MISRREIPPHAKRVFQGKIFEVWQWEQKMYDGSIATFERLKRPNTAEVVPVAGEKILIQLQEQPDAPAPFQSLPGGRCEKEEDSLVAAKRELLEETGYVSDDWVLWKEQNPVGKIEWTVYTYIARNCVKKQEPQLDAGEKISLKLVSFEEFLNLSEDPTFYEKELTEIFLRARYDPSVREGLRKLLFKN